MDQRIVYQCNVLKGINKVGDLKKLDNGYREVRLGALGAFNEAGWLYNEREGRQLLEGSAGLMRMITQNNALRGENGHPRFQPGMNQLQWFGRVNDIFEPNVCFQMRRLILDPARDERGRAITMILGEVRESGKESGWFEKQLDNPDENVCFSIRSFTDDKIIGGVKTKFLKKIVTWDAVNEPGIRNSSKYMTPSLESAPAPEIYMPEAELETVFYADALRKELAANPVMQGTGVGFESNANMVNMIAEVARPIRSFVPSSWRW